MTGSNRMRRWDLDERGVYQSIVEDLSDHGVTLVHDLFGALAFYLPASRTRWFCSSPGMPFGAIHAVPENHLRASKEGS